MNWILLVLRVLLHFKVDIFNLVRWMVASNSKRTGLSVERKLVKPQFTTCRDENLDGKNDTDTVVPDEKESCSVIVSDFHLCKKIFNIISYQGDKPEVTIIFDDVVDKQIRNPEIGEVARLRRLVAFHAEVGHDQPWIIPDQLHKQQCRHGVMLLIQISHFM